MGRGGRAQRNPGTNRTLAGSSSSFTAVAAGAFLRRVSLGTARQAEQNDRLQSSHTQIRGAKIISSMAADAHWCITSLGLLFLGAVLPCEMVRPEELIPTGTSQHLNSWFFAHESKGGVDGLLASSNS